MPRAKYTEMDFNEVLHESLIKFRAPQCGKWSYFRPYLIFKLRKVFKIGPKWCKNSPKIAPIKAKKLKMYQKWLKNGLNISKLDQFGGKIG